MGIISQQLSSEVNSHGMKRFKPFMRRLISQIYEHFHGQVFNDVIFKLSNPTALVPAHRLILASASPYFDALFKTDEGICDEIEINEIDSVTFQSLIIFCYTGKTPLTIDNVEQVLKGALLLQLEAAVSICADYLIDHITDYTLQQAYILENEAQCVLLNRKIFEYEINNFMKVCLNRDKLMADLKRTLKEILTLADDLNIVQSAEFLNFTSSKLQKLLESNDLKVESEEDVFEEVKRWYEHDSFTRKQYLPDLIACLRLTQFNKDFIMANMQSLPGCADLALEALSWIACPSERSKCTLKYTKPRVIQEKLILALCLDVKYDIGECGEIFQYSVAEDLWEKWIDIKIELRNMEVIFMDNCLIFLGGETPAEYESNIVMSWNVKSKTFTQLPSMNKPRLLHKVVILNEEIYAIGGLENGEASRSVEKYSVSEGWKFVEYMVTPRVAPGAVALNGKMYVIGGFDAVELKCVECYDPTTNSWSQCADMNEEHGDAGTIVHNGQIFVVGGCYKSSCAPVERYDPHTNEWTKICSLDGRRNMISCIFIDHQLWAFGGYCDDVDPNVSVYDEQNDKWIEKQPLPLPGPYFCFTAPKALCALNET